MMFKLDENLPSEIVDDLRQMGHDAVTMVEESLSGSPDSDLMEEVRSESRIFLTLDKGIADIRAYPPDQHHGIILFRPPTSGRGAVLDFVRRHISAILRINPSGRLLVVTERSIRTR